TSGEPATKNPRGPLTGGGKGVSRSAAAASARGLKISEGIRRQRVRTHPGLAPPANDTSDNPNAPTVVAVGSGPNRLGQPAHAALGDPKLNRRGPGAGTTGTTSPQ